MPRECKNKPDKFCYICGSFTVNKYKRNITPRVKKLYKLYFGMKLGDQDKWWAPHICCTKCFSYLSQWASGKMNNLSFGIPMVWREPTNHINDCYFCLTDIPSKYFLIHFFFVNSIITVYHIRIMIVEKFCLLCLRQL